MGDQMVTRLNPPRLSAVALAKEEETQNPPPPRLLGDEMVAAGAAIRGHPLAA